MPELPICRRLQPENAVTRRREQERRRISLSAELQELEQAIRMIVSVFDTAAAGAEIDRITARKMAAVLELIATRTRDLRRLVRGELTPEQFWREVSGALPATGSDDQDVELTEDGPVQTGVPPRRR